MKKILLLTFLPFAQQVIAQSPVNWQVKIGGNDSEYANACDTTVAGEIYAAGFIRSRSGEYVMGYPGPDVLSPDAWIVKYDRSGFIQWQHAFGGANPDEFYDIKSTADGGAIAVGRSGSTDGNITDNKGGEDMIVVKYSASGNIEWNKNLGSTLLDGARQVIVLGDGSYVIGGYSNGLNKDFNLNKGGRDIWLVQLSITGTVIRKKNFGGNSDDDVFDMKELNGKWVVAGVTNSANGDVSGSHGSTDAWVFTLNADWVLQKQKCFGSSGQDAGNGIVILPDGYALAARVNANNGDVAGLKGGYDGWIVRTDTSLNLLWSKTYGGLSNDYFNALTLTRDGNLLSAGETFSTDDDITTNAGVSDAWLIKIDPSTGVKTWSKTFGETKGDRAIDVLVWGKDDYLFAGQFSIVNNIGQGNAQLWIATSKLPPSAGPLPVKLESFDGKAFGKVNVLNWSGSSEVKLASYVLQADGTSPGFHDIVNIPASGNATNHYQYTHSEPAGITKYRLKMIDKDGRFEFSKTVLVKRGKDDVIKVYPTISSGSITIETFEPVAASAFIIIRDVSGRVCYKNNLMLQRGNNKLEIILKECAAGTYFVSCITPAVVRTQEFVKQ